MSYQHPTGTPMSYQHLTGTPMSLSTPDRYADVFINTLQVRRCLINAWQGGRCLYQHLTSTSMFLSTPDGYADVYQHLTGTPMSLGTPDRAECANVFINIWLVCACFVLHERYACSGMNVDYLWGHEHPDATVVPEGTPHPPSWNELGLPVSSSAPGYYSDTLHCFQGWNKLNVLKWTMITCVVMNTLM